MSPDSPVCCLVTASHVPQLHVFVQSLARWHSGPCYCLLADSADVTLLPAGVTGLSRRDLIDDDAWRIRQARYNPFEALMSLKPRLMRHVLRLTGRDCIYLDTDILVLQEFASRLAMPQGNRLLLTPHLAAPLAAARQDEELALLRAGVFNAGVVVAANTDFACAFLDWWDARCNDHCFNRQAEGLFVDQRWLDLAPTLFAGVAICADAGINVGHWCIGNEADISEDAAGRLQLAGVPIALLHLSGFDPLTPDRLSSHSPLPVNPVGPLGRCLAAYAQDMRRAAGQFPAARAAAALEPLGAPARAAISGAATASNGYPAGFGINLIGQFSSATGLGVTVRHTAKALRAAGVPFTCFDIDPYYPSGDVAGELADIASHFVSDPAQLRFPVNLYCMPTVEFPELVKRIPQVLKQHHFHAAVVWWETTRLHPAWIQALVKLDAVVAYSDFLAAVLANSLPLTPVIKGAQPLFLPTGIEPDRAGFGMPAGVTTFVAGFDPNSDPARKNPGGVITAFRQAFADGDPGVRMIFRLNNADSTDMARQTTKLLKDAAAGDARIGFAHGAMNYREVLALYASADVYVSLHRAEGLGLGMLESMCLGVPVVATGWSGNMSFMDHRCASLVRYRLIQVNGNHPFYQAATLGPEAVWAEPLTEDAVAWMRHLHRHPDERRRLGELGRLRAEAYRENARTLDWLHELASLWQASALLPRISGKLGTEGRP